MYEEKGIFRIELEIDVEKEFRGLRNIFYADLKTVGRIK
jgi:hypothetical protein